ncbi:MAG: OmpH family outer membrane protein [Nitrospira sp.]
MRKSLFYLVVVLLFVQSGRAFADSEKIGFVNAQKVLEISKEGKSVQEKMEEYVTTRQKVIDLEERELKQLEEDLTRQGSLLSPEAKKVKQVEFQRKLIEYQNKARELNAEVQKKKVESLRKFNKKLELAVKAIAEQEGYFVVFDKNNEGGTVIFSSESNDITPQVIEKLDGNFNK